MRAVDKTAKLFMRSVKEAYPNARMRFYRSRNKLGGRSNYIFIERNGLLPIKVRVSDHPVGMRRALYGGESLFIQAGASPASWSVWLGDLHKRLDATAPHISFSFAHEQTSPPTHDGQDRS